MESAMIYLCRFYAHRFEDEQTDWKWCNDPVYSCLRDDVEKLIVSKLSKISIPNFGSIN